MTVYESLQHFQDANSDDAPLDVLMVEVIEHMPREAALKLIKSVLGIKRRVRLFLTTPNSGFNKYYDSDEDHMRHDDHHFEFNKEEFRAFCDEAWIAGNYAAQTLFPVGDMVDGEPVTWGAMFQNV
jgi:hypothetical protein